MKNNELNSDIDINYFVSQHTMEDIIYIENNDPQFLAIQDLYQTIMSKYPSDIPTNQLLIVDLVIKIALISYQIWWTGEQWRSEVCEYIYNRREDILSDPDCINQNDRRTILLKSCKYNRRLINMKLSRLQKIWNLRSIFVNLSDYEFCYDNMELFHSKLCKLLWSDQYAKTTLFATKMFGYISRLVFDKLVIYPDWLHIPLDSRLIYIYNMINDSASIDNSKAANIYIINFFTQISKNHNIPPLHLDSLLWLKFWNTI